MPHVINQKLGQIKFMELEDRFSLKQQSEDKKT